MKLTFIFLLSGAIALSNIQNVASASFFGDVFQNLDQLGKHVRDEFIDELRNFAESTSEGTDDLENKLKDQAKEVLKNIEVFGETTSSNVQGLIINNVDRFQAILKAFTDTLEEELEKQRNTIKREALQQAKTSLEKLLPRYVSLSRTFNDVRTRVLDGVNKGEQRIEEKWNSYINKKLKEVAEFTANNETTVNQADNFLEEILRFYENNLDNCAGQVDEAVQAFKTKVDESIEAGQNILKDLLDAVQYCLDADDSSASSQECRSNITSNLLQLSDIPNEISNFVAKGASLLLIRFENSDCVVRALIKFELEKIPINITIKQIIDGTYEPEATEPIPDGYIEISNTDSADADNETIDSN